MTIPILIQVRYADAAFPVDPATEARGDIHGLDLLPPARAVAGFVEDHPEIVVDVDGGIARERAAGLAGDGFEIGVEEDGDGGEEAIGTWRIRHQRNIRRRAPRPQPL